MKAAPATVSESTPRAPVDKKGFAKWIGRHVRTVDNYIATGEVPCFKLGGVVYFDLDVVTAYFKARCKVKGNK